MLNMSCNEMNNFTLILTKLNKSETLIINILSVCIFDFFTDLKTFAFLSDYVFFR